MRAVKRFVAVAVLAMSGASCGDLVRQGRAPVYLVIDSLLGSRGGGSDRFVSPLLSDVLTRVTSPAPCTTISPCPTIFNDVGQVTLRIVRKDLGPTDAAAPSAHNAVTMTRFRVTYRRADGRNTPGVDVPYPFDGVATGTVPPGGTLVLPFELVRHVAKMESPLVQLVENPTIITTHAEVIFFGRDQVGNNVSVTGYIQIDFGNFGDEA